jgi:hypothetical protein
LISFCSNSQTRKRTIDEKVLYNLLEDNFRKDTLIQFQDSVIVSQSTTIVYLDTLSKFVLSRITKLKEINTNLVSQNTMLSTNNEVLTSVSYQLNEYINKCKANAEVIEIENKKLKVKNRILNRALLIGGASILLNAILIFK